jgi:hypothetical protein
MLDKNKTMFAMKVAALACAATYGFRPMWQVPQAFEPVLLSDGETPSVDGVPEEVAARAWRHDGRVHLLLANTLRKEVSGTAVVDGKHRYPFKLKPIGVDFAAW